MIADSSLAFNHSKINRLLLNLLHAESDETGLPVKDFSDQDWDQFIQASTQQGISGLLSARIRQSGHAAEIPARVTEELHQLGLQIALRNLRLYRELHKILAALKEADIPVIVMKGMFMAQGVYGDLASRSMGDIDILVRAEDINRADAWIRQSGYAWVDEKGGWDTYIQKDYHVFYYLSSMRVHLELHWNLNIPSSPFFLNMGELWDRALPTRIAGVDVLTFSPEDLLLTSSLHIAYHHSFDGFALRSLYDIALILAQYQAQIDWQQVQQLSQQWGSTHCTYLVLRLAQDLLGASIPAGTLSALEPRDFDPRYILWAEERIFSELDPIARPGGHPTLSHRFGEVWASQGWKKRLSSLVRACFPPLPTLAELYGLPPHSRRLFLYYPVRLIDLVRKFASSAWLFFKKDRATVNWVDWEGKRASLEAWMTPDRDKRPPSA